jgi:hypothetical protein
MITAPAEVLHAAAQFPDATIASLDDPPAAVDVTFPGDVLVQFRLDTNDPGVRQYVAITRQGGQRTDRRVVHGSGAAQAVLEAAAALAGVDLARRQHASAEPTDATTWRRSS